MQQIMSDMVDIPNILIMVQKSRFLLVAGLNKKTIIQQHLSTPQTTKCLIEQHRLHDVATTTVGILEDCYPNPRPPIFRYPPTAAGASD
jgi:hypothetical protein